VTDGADFYCGVPARYTVSSVSEWRLLSGGTLPSINWMNGAAGLTFDADYIYYSRGCDGMGPGEILRARRDSPTTVAHVATMALGASVEIAVDDTSVYWTETTCPGTSTPQAAFMRADKAGGTAAVSLLSEGAYGILVDTDAIFAVDADGIFRIDKGTGALHQLSPATPVPPFSGPVVAVDTTNIYWVSDGVWGMPKIGGTPFLIAPANRLGACVVVDNQWIYFGGATGRAGETEVDLRRVQKSGGNTYSLADRACPFAVDASYVYMVDEHVGPHGGQLLARVPTN
jgi:hypothetical protein